MSDEATQQAAIEVAQDAATLAAEVAATTDSTDEDDYQWLTERLDDVRKLTQENSELLAQVLERMNQSQTETDSIRQASQIVTEQNAQLVEMLRTTQASLTSLTETVSLRLTPPTSQSSSQPVELETTVAQTPIVPAADGRETQPESDAHAVQTSEEKKRRRI
jgi:hypothetical protein